MGSYKSDAEEFLKKTAAENQRRLDEWNAANPPVQRPDFEVKPPPGRLKEMEAERLAKEQEKEQQEQMRITSLAVGGAKSGAKNDEQQQEQEQDH